MLRPKWEVADILKLTYPKMHDTDQMPLVVQKTMHDLINCRTEALGGHLLKCSNCDNVQVSYNSCRNRHCPKCQFSKREQWILDREADVLPVRYFHVVFTIPHQLNALMKKYPKTMYGILFAAAWKTIQTLGADSKWLGAKMGMIAVLHTWGQNLSYHPHLHCIIPGGGYVPAINRWISLRHRSFLFPVKVMSALFRRMLLQSLRSKIDSGQILWDADQLKELFPILKNASFNVFAKTPFAGPRQVIKYLGRYSHRVAITNHRIKNVTSDAVSFDYRDYRTNKNKTLILTPMEFTRRFLQHVLPKGFAKIRHFGFLSNKSKKKDIAAILLYFGRKQKARKIFNPLEYFSAHFDIDLKLCPVCKTGHMQDIDVIPASRGQPLFITTSKRYHSKDQCAQTN